MSRKKLVPAAPNFEEAYDRIRTILAEARNRAYQAINTAMVLAYWEIGRTIVEEEQQGQARADYGTHLLRVLSERLTADFGKGFDRTNLQQMRNFFWRTRNVTHCVTNYPGPTPGLPESRRSASTIVLEKIKGCKL